MNILRATLLLSLFGLFGCATLPKDIHRIETYALPESGQTRISHFLGEKLAGHPGENGFQPLPDGVDALLARILLAEGSDRSLDLQYYIWHNDLTGRHLVYALLRAADRGVRVRLLLDDVGTKADDDQLLSLSAHPNLEIRLFNPVASRRFRNLGMLSDFSRTNRRMHNKAFVADSKVAILGGRNIGDEYFGASGKVAFGDLDVLTMGPIVSEVSMAFDRYWNSPAAMPISALLGRAGQQADLVKLRQALDAFIVAQRDSPYVVEAMAIDQRLQDQAARQFYWGQARLLYDDPEKITRAPESKEGTLLSQFGGIGHQVTKELLVVSPYFIPGKDGVDWFRKQTERGVKVTILTNSLAASDVGAVHAGYKRYRKDLLKAGVRLYELKPHAQAERDEKKGSSLGASRASLHAKTFVFDQREVFIGSLNLDPRSVQLNTEIGLICESPALAEMLATTIDRGIDQAAWRVALEAGPDGPGRMVWIESGPAGERRLTSEPGVGAFKKFSVWFLGLFPIESQL